MLALHRSHLAALATFAALGVMLAVGCRSSDDSTAHDGRHATAPCACACDVNGKCTPAAGAPASCFQPGACSASSVDAGASDASSAGVTDAAPSDASSATADASALDASQAPPCGCNTNDDCNAASPTGRACVYWICLSPGAKGVCTIGNRALGTSCPSSEADPSCGASPTTCDGHGQCSCPTCGCQLCPHDGDASADAGPPYADFCVGAGGAPQPVITPVAQ